MAPVVPGGEDDERVVCQSTSRIVQNVMGNKQLLNLDRRLSIRLIRHPKASSKLPSEKIWK